MLEELWYGNITPFEDFLDGRKEYKELMQLMARNRERLEKDFNAEYSPVSVGIFVILLSLFRAK